MQIQQTIRWIAVLIAIVQCVDSLEIFIKNTNSNADPKVEQLEAFNNKTYSIPLFQTRYITMRINPKHLRRTGDINDQNIVGFKLQVKSTDVRVVNIQKEVKTPIETNRILLEDLFILPHQNGFGHVFNVYPSPTLIQLPNFVATNVTWLLTGTRMDETKLTFVLDVFYNDDSTSSYTWSLNVLITQPKRLVDRIFFTLMPFLIIFISIQMGILLDTKILIDLVKKPKAVLVGFVSQYGLMPFLAMGIAKVFHYSPLYSLALFVIGCCPGSGASNQWTLLFDGDVNLSAVMSFVSTASSFVMMPLYFYTFGRIYMDKLSIRVPFLGLARSLALVVVPYSVGIGISHCSPKIRSWVQRMVKPLMLFLLIFFLFFGSIVNWYLIKTIDLYTALTAPLLPYLGFVLGALLAWIFRLEWSHIKTVGIEAGIQNTGIAFMIILYSFPQPYATQAIVVPLVVAFLTTKPFWLVYVIRNQIIKHKKNKALQTKDETMTSNEKVISAQEEATSKQGDVVEMMQNL